MKTGESRYLGDSVYVTFDCAQLTLTTDSHKEVDAGNVIVLEVEVAQALANVLGELGVVYDKA